MQRRFGVLFATRVLISFMLAACRTRTAPVEDDQKAPINVVLAHEQAVQRYDFNKVDSLHTPDARRIEESYPQLFEPAERRDFQPYKDAGMRIDYHPQDAVAYVRGNVAWVTVTLHSTWAADSLVGRAMLGGSAWRATYVESFILVKTPAGWKIAFGHTSMLPPDFGVEPDYQQEHGGMKFAEVAEPHDTSTHKMCELASTANKPQLSGLRLEVKIIRSSGKGWVCWFGVRRVIKAEGASCCDEFALHFRVGFSPGKRRPRGNEINRLLIAGQDIRAKLTA
jgi:hypothetical protein